MRDIGTRGPLPPIGQEPPRGFGRAPRAGIDDVQHPRAGALREIRRLKLACQPVEYGEPLLVIG